ncbi:MAG: LamG domain-containing protein [Myxococcales bacterium]|nr:MAG: LamG domain-containing protein [Myxococcales bacterium]
MELAAFALLASCSTYDELAPLPPDLPIGAASGSGGASAGSGLGGSSGAMTGGTPGASGSASPQGGSESGPGGSVSGGSVSGGSAAGGSASGSGQGGMPPTQCADCAALKSALLHRYDFEGEGEAVMDRVGTKHGTVEGGGTLSKVGGKGVVVLSGGTTGPYVDLPNGLLSSLTSVTLETWITWGGGDSWQRVFDFGSSSAATEGTPEDGATYLFLTPTTDAAADGPLRGVFSVAGGAATAETRVSGAAALPQALAQVVVVVDSAAEQIELYVDGASTGEQPFTGSLAELDDVNCWLGRSQYESDPELTGTLHDFRIYGAALTAAQIATSFTSGPDPAFLAQ